MDKKTALRFSGSSDCLPRRRHPWAANTRRRRCLTGCFIAATLFAAGTAQADVFNLGGSQNPDGSWTGLASLEFVTVGHPGNSPDPRVMNDGTTGYGAVDYVYEIGKFEVTVRQYAEFLNAVAATDTYGLCRQPSSNGITRTGEPGSYVYNASAAFVNRPVNWTNWGDAARFVNWLHNGQPTGSQDSTTTEDGAYSLNGATTNVDLPVPRKPGALYVIPAENEWYKAAYYDPAMGGTGGYWLYPTGSNTRPSNNLIDPDPGNNATFFDGDYTIEGPYWRTEVGAHENSASVYGTFDQGGNNMEWYEGVTHAGWRGGSWPPDYDWLEASYRVSTFNATNSVGNLGFRVARVPEPSSLLALGGVLALSMIRTKEGVRHKKGGT